MALFRRQGQLVPPGLSSRPQPPTPAYALSEAHRVPALTLLSFPTRQHESFEPTLAPSSRSGFNVGGHIKRLHFNDDDAIDIYFPRTATIPFSSLDYGSFIEYRHHIYTTQSLISFVSTICCNKKRAYTGAQHYKKFGHHGAGYLLLLFGYLERRTTGTHLGTGRKIPCTTH